MTKPMTNLQNNPNETPCRSDKEKLLNQHAQVIWLTGLSGAGKTTIAKQMELELNNRGYLVRALDGDVMRTGLNSNLGFSEDARTENIRRIAEVSKLFVDCGIICINSFITPTYDIRQMAKDIIGESDFIEVFVNAPLAVCEKRDVKGLYQKARDGELKNFTGIDAPYEPPQHPDIEVRTDVMSVDEAVEKCLSVILDRVGYGRKKGAGC